MGIVNIDDDLHDQLRRASKVSCRSINAQAVYWIKICQRRRKSRPLGGAKPGHLTLRVGNVGRA